MHVLSCESQYAKALQGANSVPVCISESQQLNGSAVALYNSSTIYDKLLWAATWMYRATGDTDYLGDAESFYISHIYNEGGDNVSGPLPAHQRKFSAWHPQQSHLLPAQMSDLISSASTQESSAAAADSWSIAIPSVA